MPANVSLFRLRSLRIVRFMKALKPGVAAAIIEAMVLPRSAAPDPQWGVAKKMIPVVLSRMGRNLASVAASFNAWSHEKV